MTKLAVKFHCSLENINKLYNEVYIDYCVVFIDFYNQPRQACERQRMWNLDLTYKRQRSWTLTEQIALSDLCPSVSMLYVCVNEVLGTEV